VLLTKAIEKVKGITHDHLQLHAFDSRDYIAFAFKAYIEHLIPGDNYFAISTMGFFSKNKISGGIRGYFEYNKRVCAKGVNIKRIIFADSKRINYKGKDGDYFELIAEIENCNNELKNIKGKGVFQNKVTVVDDYNKILNRVKGFGLIQRGSEYILILPENVKSKGDKPKIQIYFSNGKDKKYLKFIGPALDSFNHANSIKSKKLNFKLD
jgi:hypothetical protein